MGGVRLLRPPSADRLVGVDVARCVALLAMMSTHMLRPVEGSDVLWSQTVAGGRASGLFAVLAGVSLALMTGRQQPHRRERRMADAAGITARAGVIAVVGLVLASLDTNVAVILVYYALLFLLALPFLALRPATLAVLAGVWSVAAPVLSHLLRPHLGLWPPSVPTLGDFEVVTGLLRDLLFTGYYPAFPWLTYMLAGLALGRLDLARPVVAAKVAGLGAAAAVISFVLSRNLTSGATAQAALLSTSPEPVDGWPELKRELQVGLHGTTPTESWWWLTVVAPHSGTTFDLVHTTGVAAGVIGLALLAARARPAVWAVVFGAGAMPLSVYTAHVIMLTQRVWPGLGLEGYVRQVVVLLLVGACFALARSRGPLEALARAAFLAAARSVAAPRRPRL
jgi:uncharacterized membrane protein